MKMLCVAMGGYLDDKISLLNHTEIVYETVKRAICTNWQFGLAKGKEPKTKTLMGLDLVEIKIEVESPRRYKDMFFSRIVFEKSSP